MFDLFYSFDTISRFEGERFERDLERRRQIVDTERDTNRESRFTALRQTIARAFIVTGERIRSQVA